MKPKKKKEKKRAKKYPWIQLNYKFRNNSSEERISKQFLKQTKTIKKIIKIIKL